MKCSWRPSTPSHFTTPLPTTANFWNRSLSNRLVKTALRSKKSAHGSSIRKYAARARSTMCDRRYSAWWKNPNTAPVRQYIRLMCASPAKRVPHKFRKGVPVTPRGQNAPSFVLWLFPLRKSPLHVHCRTDHGTRNTGIDYRPQKRLGFHGQSEQTGGKIGQCHRHTHGDETASTTGARDSRQLDSRKK